MFTSGLSASEFLLVRDAGFEPAGLVMGSSVCHLALQPPVTSVAQLTGPSFGTIFANVPKDGGEVAELSRAMSLARDTATTRLEQDARRLGADGVIDIRVESEWDSWYAGALEFTMTGTAVRRADVAPGSTADDCLFTCDLSGQDFWKLLQSGYRPAGLVIGYCAYAAEPGSAFGNRELTGPTRAVYTARRLAVARMRNEAERLGATGIVGVRLDGLGGLSRPAGSRTVEFRAGGTAIAPVPEAHGIRPSATVLGL
jgi:uncharacterized protein YbjQ (UPF0145 family)